MGKRSVKPGGQNSRQGYVEEVEGWHLLRPLRESHQVMRPPWLVSKVPLGVGREAALLTSMVTDSRPDRDMTVAKD